MGRFQFETPGCSSLPRILSATLLFAVASSAGAFQAPHPAQQTDAAKEPAQQLVREVVYNELHDRKEHGYWSYWIRQAMGSSARLSEVVETPAGPIKRVVLKDGRPLDAQSSQVEQANLEELANSPDEQASHREAYAEDEQRVTRIMAMLPDAFCFEDAGESGGIRHLRFRPNPNYSAHSIEGRVFHALNGDLWIDARQKRMTRIEGHLDEDLTFGFGLLARVNRGGWFRMERRQVSAQEWKTDVLEIHMSGRAILFKTIAHETSEVRGGFKRVPPDLTVAQGVRLLEEADPTMAAELAPVAFTRGQ